MNHAAASHRKSDNNRSLFRRSAGMANGPEPTWLDTVPVRESDLPPSDTIHWSASRKAIIVAAVKSGILTLPKACLRYGLTPEELEGWQRVFERFGPAGLRCTQVQRYRERDSVNRKH